MVELFSNYLLLEPLQSREKKLKGHKEESDVVSFSGPVRNSISSGEVEESAPVVRVGVVEFLPIEHPVVPPDDRPAKCPLSDYSFRDDAEEETFAVSLRKRLQWAADGERHLIITTRDAAAAAATASQSKCPQHFFHMFQHCKE